MDYRDIEVHLGGTSKPFKVLGRVKARKGAFSALSKKPTYKEVNEKLRKKAYEMGANAILHVEYKRGISATSWKTLWAKGTAVKIENE